MIPSHDLRRRYRRVDDRLRCRHRGIAVAIPPTPHPQWLIPTNKGKRKVPGGLQVPQKPDDGRRLHPGESVSGRCRSPQPRTTPPTSRSHSPRPARRNGAKMRRRGRTRGLEVPQEPDDGHGLRPGDSVSGRCRVSAASCNIPPRRTPTVPAQHASTTHKQG